MRPCVSKNEVSVKFEGTSVFNAGNLNASLFVPSAGGSWFFERLGQDKFLLLLIKLSTSCHSPCDESPVPCSQKLNNSVDQNETVQF
jgi:hypothetical protein